MKGLDMMREIRSGRKKLEIVIGGKRSEVNEKLLEQIESTDAASENIIAEIEKMRNHENYDIAGLRKKIDSYPSVIAVKKSDKPENERKEEYARLIDGLIRHEVREIFRNNEIVGSVAKIALHLENVVHRDLVKLVDPGENVLQVTGQEEEKGREDLNSAEIEEKIAAEFSELEKEFIATMTRKYPKELLRAKKKIKGKGGTVDEKWADSVRTSYIGDIKRAGVDKDRWGTKTPLAPEKADLLEQYLDLKLPTGIPEEKEKDKPEDRPQNRVRNNEFSENGKFSEKQLKKLHNLLTAVRKYADKIEQSELEGMIGELISEEPVLNKMFTEKKARYAVEWVLKGIKS